MVFGVLAERGLEVKSFTSAENCGYEPASGGRLAMPLAVQQALPTAKLAA